MSRFALKECLLAGAIVAAFTIAGATAQPAAVIPDFSSGQVGWAHGFGGEFPPVPGSTSPTRQDPGHSFVSPQQNFRIGDLTNPNLKEWVKEAMKKDNDEVDAGKIQFTAHSSCLPPGVPVFNLYGGPLFFVQTEKQVVMIMEDDAQVRHIYMNVPHSANPKPSWLGESVGHYEGDTLVIDTIGQNTKTVVDSFRTPHSEKLHVVERWHLIDGGKGLEVNITVDDPDAFNQPWSTLQRYQRAQRQLDEAICAENNQIVFDYHIPVANKPDF